MGISISALCVVCYSFLSPRLGEVTTHSQQINTMDGFVGNLITSRWTPCSSNLMRTPRSTVKMHNPRILLIAANDGRRHLSIHRPTYEIQWWYSTVTLRSFSGASRIWPVRGSARRLLLQVSQSSYNHNSVFSHFSHSRPTLSHFSSPSERLSHFSSVVVTLARVTGPQ